MYQKKHLYIVLGISSALAFVFVAISGFASTANTPASVLYASGSGGTIGGTSGGGIGTSGGHSGGDTFGGTVGGVTGGTFGGTFGGIIGGGGVGIVSTGGGGGSAVRPSAGKAPPGTCASQDEDGNTIKRTCVPLVQPLGGRNRIEVRPGVQTFIDYFNDASDLLLTISVGFAVLWILIGSYFIMVSGSNGGMRTQGQEMIKWALIGLIIVNFAGFFLRTLNSMFFT